MENTDSSDMAGSHIYSMMLIQCDDARSERQLQSEPLLIVNSRSDDTPHTVAHIHMCMPYICTYDPGL